MVLQAFAIVALSTAKPDIDPAALNLLKQVESRMAGVKSFSAGSSTSYIKPSKHTGFRINLSLRLKRPNYSRVIETFQSFKNGTWGPVEPMTTYAITGGRSWRVNDSKNQYITNSAEPTGEAKPLMYCLPLTGFYGKEGSYASWLSSVMAINRVKSAKVLPAAGGLREVSIVYQPVGEAQDGRMDFFIGKDLLVHRVEALHGGVHILSNLSEIRVDQPMAPQSFAFLPPPGSVPDPQTEKEPVGPPPLPLGTQAPDFTMEQSDGHQVKLSDFRGKTVILDFWASWCGNCTSEFPFTNKMAKEDKNLVVLSVDICDPDSLYRKWLKANPSYDGLKFLLDKEGVNGKGLIQAQYNAVGLPSQFVIDPSGKVSAYLSGYDSEWSKRISEAIKKAEGTS